MNRLTEEEEDAVGFARKWARTQRTTALLAKPRKARSVQDPRASGNARFRDVIAKRAMVALLLVGIVYAAAHWTQMAYSELVHTNGIIDHRTSIEIASDDVGRARLDYYRAIRRVRLASGRAKGGGDYLSLRDVQFEQQFEADMEREGTYWED